MGTNQLLFNLLKSGEYDKFKIAISKIEPHKINIKDDNHNYLLTYAIIRNNIEIIKILLDKGAKIDIIDQEGKTILYLPIKYGYDQIIKVLLDYDNTTTEPYTKLVDQIDSHNNIPLHYAIMYKNEYAVAELLNNNSDTNAKDNNDNTSLHLSIYAKNYNICKLIVDKGTNINAITNIGESALHISINMKLHDISKLLLDNKIDTNIQDSNNEITALMYTIYLHDVMMFKLLLKHDANPNLQDSMGNSSIHHIIIEENDELLNILLNKKKHILNFNIHNIDSKLVAHLLLEKVIKENDMTKYIVNQSDLNYQDNEGNTPLHLITKKHLWVFLEDSIINKKLNIFIRNYNNIRPVDYVSKHDIPKFFELIAQSYNNVLKNKNFAWSTDWENLCKEDLHYNNLNKNKLKVINKYIDKNFDKSKEICSQIIVKKLHEMYSCEKCDKYCSYPIKEGAQCIKINKNEEIESCNFVGLSIDVLFGVIYLIKKHQNICSVTTANFIKNNEMCSYLSVIGYETNIKCEFMNFEIVWIYKKLFFSENFVENFKKCVNNKQVRFVIVPLGIEIKEGSHANYIIFDKQTYELERFEPYGAHSPSNYNYNEHLLDSILAFKFNEIYDNIKYISPEKYLPKIGFQYLDVYERKTKKIGDPGGFCALWAIWYVDMRVKHANYDLDRKSLVEKLLKEIRAQGLLFKQLIRDYSINVTQIRDKVFNDAGININGWINNEYSAEQYESVINGIRKLLG